MIVETGLYSNIFGAKIQIENFKIFRGDRTIQGHGGVCIYLWSDISAQVVLSESRDSVESLLIKAKQMKMHIFVVYMLGKIKPKGFLEVMRNLIQEIPMIQANS